MTAMDVLDDLGRAVADLAKAAVERRGEVGTLDAIRPPPAQRPERATTREGKT